MKGYPKYLQTKEDYEYVRTNFPKEMWLNDFQALLDSRFVEEFDHFLADDEVIPESVPHKVMVQDEGEGVAKRALYIRKEDIESKIFKLGYTVEEVEGYINS